MRGWIVGTLGCVYAAPAGARIFRYWSRYTQVGAYTRKCTGCVPTQRVSFRKVSARVRGGDWSGRDGTNGQDRPRTEREDTRPRRRTPHAEAPKGCRADVTQRGRGRRDVRTAPSPLATASNRHPRVALRCATPFVPAARCLDALTAQQHSRTKATVLTAITRGAPHGVLYGGRPRPRGSCRKRPGASAACSRTSSVESISSRWSR